MDKDVIVETAARNGTDPTSSASTDPTADDAGAAGEAGAIDDAAAATGAPDVSTGFLSELTEAMMGVVGKERDRIGAIVEADAAGHLVEAKERAATEAEAFRQIADEDVANIEAWADAEVERIRGDAASRIADRRADLDTALAQQEAVLDNELKSIETAVADYDVTLQSYLDDLRSTGDPAEIAERAHSLPAPPALDDVRAVARAEALTRIAEEAAAAGAPAIDAEATADDGADGDDDAAGVAGDADPAVATADAPSREATGSSSDDSDHDDDAPIEPSGEDDSAAPTDAGAAIGAIPVLVDGGSASRTGWESDGGLEALIDPPARAMDTGSAGGSAPVAVMDPAATSSLGWETATDTSAPTAVATAERSDVGHPNAAVRLIRSVAPWTAPTHQTDRTDTLPD